jgi:hypothetical protein
LITYLFGGGVTDVVDGVRTPFFDGPTVSGIGLMGLMAFRFRAESTSFGERFYWITTAFLGYFFVLVCFRRSYWGELFVGTLILLVLNRKLILRNIPLIGMVLVFALAVSGHMLYQRITNIAPTSDDPVYAATNLDHLNDILDAFDHVKEHPIAGIGVGVPYETFRIVGWKTESWGVHNAIMHVWLLYGLFGLLTYLWFHFRLIGWLKAQSRNCLPSCSLPSPLPSHNLLCPWGLRLGRTVLCRTSLLLRFCMAAFWVSVPQKKDCSDPAP